MKYALSILFVLAGCGSQMAETPTVIEAPKPIPEAAPIEPDQEGAIQNNSDLSELDEKTITAAAEAEGWIVSTKPRTYMADHELLTVAIRTDDRAGFVLLYKGKVEALNELQPRLGPATARGLDGGLLLAVVLQPYPEQALALLKRLTTQGEEKACCVTCKEGKPCGNTCIQADWKCTKEPGCACAGP